MGKLKNLYFSSYFGSFLDLSLLRDYKEVRVCDKYNKLLIELQFNIDLARRHKSGSKEEILMIRDFSESRVKSSFILSFISKV